MKHYKGNTVTMTEDAIENYGEDWRDVRLVVTHVATEYMPAKQFYAKGQPDGYHPGYDGAVPNSRLYDLKRQDNGEELNFSLYDWEVKAAN